MNIKLHTPSSLKAGSGMATLKQFWLSLLATTISIALTFGTAAFIDHKKKQKDKREIVMMLMHDMKYSLDAAEKCDAKLVSFVDKQIEVLKHPETFQTEVIQLIRSLPNFDYSKTAENIFNSNVETVNTIGNVHFVEFVSTFYTLRDSYKNEVVDSFLRVCEGFGTDYDKLAAFNSCVYPLLSQSILKNMKQMFNQCKLLMKISDEELTAFSEERDKLLEAARDKKMEQQMKQAVTDNAERQQRFMQAVEEGKK